MLRKKGLAAAGKKARCIALITAGLVLTRLWFLKPFGRPCRPPGWQHKAS